MSTNRAFESKHRSNHRSKADLVEEFRSRNRYFHRLEEQLYHLDIERSNLMNTENTRSEPLGDRTDNQVYTELMEQSPGEVVKNLKWIGSHIANLEAEIRSCQMDIQELKGSARSGLPVVDSSKYWDSGLVTGKGSMKSYGKGKHAQGFRKRKPKLGGVGNKGNAIASTAEQEKETKPEVEALGDLMKLDLENLQEFPPL